MTIKHQFFSLSENKASTMPGRKAQQPDTISRYKLISWLVASWLNRNQIIKVVSSWLFLWDLKTTPFLVTSSIDHYTETS